MLRYATASVQVANLCVGLVGEEGGCFRPTESYPMGDEGKTKNRLFFVLRRFCFLRSVCIRFALAVVVRCLVLVSAFLLQNQEQEDVIDVDTGSVPKLKVRTVYKLYVGCFVEV